MGLLGWIALGYAVLLVPAGFVAVVFCRAARLSDTQIEPLEREILLWGSIPTSGSRTVRDLWIAQRGGTAPEIGAEERDPDLSSGLSPYF